MRVCWLSSVTRCVSCCGNSSCRPQLFKSRASSRSFRLTSPTGHNGPRGEPRQSWMPGILRCMFNTSNDDLSHQIQCRDRKYYIQSDCKDIHHIGPKIESNDVKTFWYSSRFGYPHLSCSFDFFFFLYLIPTCVYKYTFFVLPTL